MQRTISAFIILAAVTALMAVGAKPVAAQDYHEPDRRDFTARPDPWDYTEPEVHGWTGPMSEFSAYDIDLSGSLSRAEFTRAADPRLEDRGFDEFDLDHDDEVEPWELRQTLRGEN